MEGTAVDSELPGGILYGSCALRVKEDIQIWRKGELMCFSGASEHEAWNYTNEERIVFLFDFGGKKMNRSKWPKTIRAQVEKMQYPDLFTEIDHKKIN